LELGADQGILISDRKFAGADTLATALTLSAVIQKFAADYRLILVGKQSIDGDTAQVGPALAEILGLPQIMYGIDISLSPDCKRINVIRENEAYFELVETHLPALVSISKGKAFRRMPSLLDFLGVRDKSIKKISANELEVKSSEFGLAGSLTHVVNIFEAKNKNKSNCKRINGHDPGSAAKKIISFMKAEKFV
jgi:electron transfer flavoprotein beta subunit